MPISSPTLRDLHDTLGGKLRTPAADATGAEDVRLGPIAIDSRKIQPGEVFWALQGARRNGTDFAADAFARGAAGAVVNRTIEVPADRWAMVVDNTQDALWRWAAWNRRRFSGTVIAVTGSVGKTTTRQMIHTVLGSRLSGTASPYNYNNHIGLPLSLLAVEPHHDYTVLELGASGPGEIAALAALCAPKVGVITQVGDAHLGGFGTRSGIAEAKAELLAVLPEDGRAVLGDDPWLRHVAERSPAPISWVGREATCDVAAERINSGGGTLRFRVGPCEFRVPVWGRHHLTSALAAVAVGQMMGLDLETIAEALSRFDPLPMRCEVTEVRGATIIDDTYNANPTAMQAALELLRDFDALGRRIAVCGDMAELGDESEQYHRLLGEQAVTLAGVDLLIACGQFARDVVAGAREAGLPHARAIPCRTSDETLPYLGQVILPGDVVLVKGSRVMAMECVVDALHQYPRRRTA